MGLRALVLPKWIRLAFFDGLVVFSNCLGKRIRIYAQLLGQALEGVSLNGEAAIHIGLADRNTLFPPFHRTLRTRILTCPSATSQLSQWTGVRRAGFHQRALTKFVDEDSASGVSHSGSDQPFGIDLSGWSGHYPIHVDSCSPDGFSHDDAIPVAPMEQETIRSAYSGLYLYTMSGWRRIRRWL